MAYVRTVHPHVEIWEDKYGDDVNMESFLFYAFLFHLSHRGTTDPDITSPHKVIKLT